MCVCCGFATLNEFVFLINLIVFYGFSSRLEVFIWSGS
jgi:hypothetical protein